MNYFAEFHVCFWKALVLLGLCTVCWCQVTGGVESTQQTIPDSPLVKELNERLTKRVNDWNFKLETYEATTKDRYILKIHRLMKDESYLKSPLLIMHGITACSPVFLAFRQSIAYHLAEEGYDVWVGNARGTAFSMKHLSRKPQQRKFWDFSFHEIGILDIPAFLLKIKEVTGREKVHYVGMSMGTTAFLVLASTTPKVVREHVASVTLLAPVACPRNHVAISSRTKRTLIGFALKTIRLISRGDFYTYRKSIASLKHWICRSKRLMGTMCEKLFRSTSAGKDLFDHVGALEVLPFFPCGASIKSFLHFLQMAAAGKFQQYDYGRFKNYFNHYGSPTPLEYDLRSIEKKLNIIAGGEDRIADKRDIQWLEERLTNYKHIDAEKYKDFDHADFEYGTQIHLISEDIMTIIREEEKEPQREEDNPSASSVNQEGTAKTRLNSPNK